ncbi:MAG: hypothetical protein IKS66_07750, partial [Oscillospiraceae bacterium]|nr:hypothetical protein [Oscillospiraceae bacterium]
MKRILISCPGTSDPVRGEHDGPMLHILRRYRPELALQILSPEMRGNEQRDGRFEKTRAWIAAHWEGDCPAFRYLDLSGTEVHDMDALERPLREAMAAQSGEFPEAEILVNVTSGTPQMQIVLSQLAIDTRYRARAVQVLNFERRSGTSMRTNTRDYDTELELECNEDEQPDAPNRCVEPQLYALARAHTRTQILQLLESRDFEALETLQDRLPEELGALALHLAARSRLDGQEARRRASQVKGLPFQL